MKNNINESAYFERMRQLADVDKKLIKESKNSTLLDYKEAGDGRVYGIVKENANYFIKTAIKKDNINESDFAYIGGLSNITEYKCKSLTDAQRVLNTKVMTVNETYGYVKEDEEEAQAAPAPQPAPQPAPEAPVEPQPEQSADDVAPAEAPAVDDETINQVKSHVGKAGNLLSGIEIPSEKSKQVIKMFLGYFNIEGMSDEDKNEIARMFKSEQDTVQEVYLKEEMDQQTIEMIISGIGALATVGLGFAIDPLKRLLSRSSVGKKIVSGLEDVGSAAADATRSGMSKGKYNESDSYLKEEDELEDDILDVMPEEPMDTPEMMDEPMDIEVKSGEKKVSIDLNAGTVDVNLSEGKVKQLAKKYNVSESYIKWKIRDIMNEEIENAEKNKLKEEKVRKVVRNIIMEKLGLKKKPLNESTSKERVKLEKLVESVLKKNIK